MSDSAATILAPGVPSPWASSSRTSARRRADARRFARYLREFLSDPRVIELPRWKWLPILYLFVLTFRPKKSAALYRKIWTDAGSPLLVLTRRWRRRSAPSRRAHGDAGRGRRRHALRQSVDGVRDARAGEARLPSHARLPALPAVLGHTTASTFDAVFAELSTWRWIPELRTVASYHDDEATSGAIAQSIRDSGASAAAPRSCS
jgi:ferrochelatase